uniref:Vitellogenin domain-containing protein n=1 Tax=Caenorhabditis tropicalis TaxID=1561998 RepID=A0A1I7TPD7_9PELO
MEVFVSSRNTCTLSSKPATIHVISNKEWFNGTSSGTTIVSKMKKYFTKTHSSEQQNVTPILQKVGYCCGDSLQYRKTFTRCDAEPNSRLIQLDHRTFYDEESGQVEKCFVEDVEPKTDDESGSRKEEKLENHQVVQKEDQSDYYLDSKKVSRRIYMA